MYFNFFTLIDEDKFRTLKESQNFYIEFKEYINVIMKNLDKVEKEPNAFYPVFTIFSDSFGKFTVIQKTEFKNYEVLCFDCKKAEDVPST